LCPIYDLHQFLTVSDPNRMSFKSLFADRRSPQRWPALLPHLSQVARETAAEGLARWPCRHPYGTRSLPPPKRHFRPYAAQPAFPGQQIPHAPAQAGAPFLRYAGLLQPRPSRAMPMDRSEKGVPNCGASDPIVRPYQGEGPRSRRKIRWRQPPPNEPWERSGTRETVLPAFLPQEHGRP
jgi:hypothetical protein